MSQGSSQFYPSEIGRQLVGAYLDGHQHGVSMPISINLGKKKLSASIDLAYEKFCDLNLGESPCILTIFVFPDSGVYLLDSFFLFLF